MTSKRWLSWSALAAILWMPAAAQPVISARAGLIHFFDGLVFLDGQPIEQRPGRFDQMNEGSELRTHGGRAELLLTPGAFLRIGPNSAIRMDSNRLADTRVRFLNGSIIVDEVNPSPRSAVTIIYSDYQVQIGKQGRFRFNSDPPELRVENGDVQVLLDGQAVTVREGYVIPFLGELAARSFDPQTRDSLDNWNQARSNSVAQDNLEAANTSDLSSVIDNWQNDPFAALQAMGMSGSIPPAGYAPSSIYVPWLTSPLGLSPLSPWGLGLGRSFGFYPLPVYRYYQYRPPIVRSPVYSFPPSRLPGTTGVGRSPVYGGAAPRPGNPAPGAPVRPAHPIGHR